MRPHIFYAPKKLEKDIKDLKGVLKSRTGMKKKEFDALWTLLCTKIRRDALTTAEIEEATKIVQRFEKQEPKRRLEMNDVYYLALKS